MFASENLIAAHLNTQVPALSMAFVPSAPLLIPALTGPQVSIELAALRTQVQRIVTELGQNVSTWHVVGVCEAGSADFSERIARGSFQKFGVDFPVQTYPETEARTTCVEIEMPLPMLIASWLRQRYAPHVQLIPQMIADDSTEEQLQNFVTKLHQEISQIQISQIPSGLTELATELTVSRGRTAVLVIADGSRMLNMAAPGGYNEQSVKAQEKLEETIFAGRSVAVPIEIGDELGITGLRAWRAASELAAVTIQKNKISELAIEISEKYSERNWGVGYVCALWNLKTKNVVPLGGTRE